MSKQIEGERHKIRILIRCEFMDQESQLFVIAVLVVVIKDRKLLMMKRSPLKKVAPGVWEVLSGRLNRNEQPHEGLLREIQEESGIEVDLDSQPFDLYVTRYGDRPMLALVYKASWIKGEVKLSNEHTDYKWATLREFEEKSTIKKLIRSIQKLKDFLQY
jgi:8-oxo-dGTP diphosphatase